MKYKDLYTLDLDEAVRLTPAELKKPNSKNGIPRIDILQDLAMSGTGIPLVDGSVFVVTDSSSAQQEINKFRIDNKMFMLTGLKDGKLATIKLSDIAKSEIFGGGAASGRSIGSTNTALYESAQAVYCSLIVNVLKREAALEDITLPNMTKAYSKCDVTESIDKIISDLPPDWIKSSILIANSLYRNGYIKSGMTFHRGSSAVNNIYKTANKLFKKEDVFYNGDKWNPADIWAQDGSFSLDDRTINTLNTSLVELFNKRKLVGISLKKVIGEPTLELYNDGSRKNTIKKIEFDIRGGDSSRSTFSTASKTRIKFFGKHGAGVVGFRSFQYQSNFAMQIEGSANAFGGRMGLAPINSILKMFKLNTVDANVIKSLINKPFKDSTIREYFKIYQKYNAANEFPKFEDFKAFMLSKQETDVGRGWLWSKMIAMKIGHIIASSSKSAEVFNELLNYAGSASLTSSIFVKTH